MRIAYVSDSRLPSERANSIQVAKTCEALSKAGADVTLLLPKRAENKKKRDKDIWEYYRIKHKFKIKRIPVVDAGAMKMIPHAWFALSTGTFALSALLYFKMHGREFDIIYTRHEPTAAMVGKFIPGRPKLVYEAHKFSKRRASLVSVSDAIVTITKSLQELYSKELHLPIAVAPDAVDPDQFGNLSKKDARKKLPLDQKGSLAVYAGGLYRWKGVETVVAAAKEIPTVRFLIVGGSEREIKHLKKRSSKNVEFIGRVPSGEVPAYLSAADVLLLPNTNERISREFTSPLKLFEYMASERPIVASDLPSFHEILDDKTAFFFKPEDPKQLAKGIEKAMGKVGKEKAKKARLEAGKYSWDARAEKILSFLEKRANKLK